MPSLISSRLCGHSRLQSAGDARAAGGSAAPDPRKEAAIAAAQALSGNEAGSVDFILASTYSDARGIAAANVVSREAVEKVWQATRNTDRRVAKLMQARLDEYKRAELAARQAQDCIASAERLLAAPRLLANEVVDLDHAWQIAGQPAEAEIARFAALRSQLAARLEHQAGLQHDLLDALGRLRRLTSALTLDRAAAQQALDETAAAMRGQLSDAESGSLPAHLMHDLDNAHDALRARLAEPEITMTEAAPVAEAAQDKPAREKGAKDKPAKDKAAKEKPAEDPAARKAFNDALAGLEKALQEGALHLAADHDHALRAPTVAALRLNDKQQHQLAAARAELGRLQGWARWGGQVSREELLKAAVDLPGQQAAPAELAKKVGALRASWKALDGTLGAAPKELWSQFDAACTTAYAPAAAHFKKLSDERAANRDRATALVAEARALAAQLADPSATDWKKLAHFVDWSRETWRRTGAMDRKDKKRLDGEHAAALAPLEQALAARRADEVKQRETLIIEVGALQPQQRGSLDRLRSLQERWQHAARSMPLERRVEQALWQRFRKACDTLFAARKEVASHADAERKEHLVAREALLATLEAALGEAEPQLNKVLRETRDAWHKAGEVPRAAEKKIEARYKAALDAAQKRLDIARRAAQDAAAHALRDKLQLCLQAEAAVLAGAAPDDALQATWNALPAVGKELEAVLAPRFAAAVKGGAAYAATLQKNQASLATELLRAEITLGLDSPAALARDRLALQVEVLKSALKSGQQAGSGSPLARLCGLAAATDAAQAERLFRIVEHVPRSKR